MSQDQPSIFEEAYLHDPFPHLAVLRAEDPMHWNDEIQCWQVTRHADVKALLADPRLSRDRKISAQYKSPEPGTWAYRFDNEGLASDDPESHRRWRSQISAGFTPRAVRRMESQVRDVVSQFGDPLAGQAGTVDLMSTFTNPIPNTVISRITGIPPYPGDEDRFRCIAQDVIRRFFLYADAENVRRGEQALDELGEWIGKLSEERLQERQEDLISDLLHDDQAEQPMSSSDIVILIAGLVAAGSETTTLGGTHALRLLFEHPEEFDKLRRDPSLSLNAVREALRFGFGAPAAGNPRFALEDVELHGKQIKKGQMLMLNGASANRDHTVFEDPDRFDITRDCRDSLVFGHGAHYCLGANLALQEMTCMLDSALAFLPDGATLLEDQIEWETIGLMRRPTTLPVSFD